ncbi:MAG: hypothetical protein O3C40_13990 [Planctomycetota bacterium]|nr:hypothetical protein [Planctomycetota bacterium]
MLANAIIALPAIVLFCAGYGSIAEVIRSVKRGYFRFCIDRRVYRHQHPWVFWAYCGIVTSMGAFVVSIAMLLCGLCLLSLFFP